MQAIAERRAAPTSVFVPREPAPKEARDDLVLIDNIVSFRRRLKRGETLFNPGDQFTAVYTVHSGFFKACLVDEEGREQVSGFFMAGDILGLDGLGLGRHNGAAVALEDSEVYVMPYALVEEAARKNSSVQHHLHAVLAREIVRDHGMMMLLGSLRAEERLAAFLINLSKRFVRRGYSPSDFHLRMTREEIGSYLGLKLETVSRLFSTLAKDSLVEVNQKHVRILDIPGLERLLKR